MISFILFLIWAGSLFLILSNIVNLAGMCVNLGNPAEMIIGWSTVLLLWLFLSLGGLV